MGESETLHLILNSMNKTGSFQSDTQGIGLVEAGRFATLGELSRPAFATPVNARVLQGDVDFELEGDPDDSLIGDLEMGGITKLQRGLSYGAAAAGGAGLALGTRALIRKMRANRDGMVNTGSGHGYHYIAHKGLELVSSPVPYKAAGSTSSFHSALQRATTENAAVTQVVDATYAPGTHSITTAALGTRLFVPFYIVGSASQLVHRPGVRFTVNMTIPTASGSLVVNPLVYRTTKKNEFLFRVLPFSIVSLEQFPALGSQTGASPITVSITGLDTAATADYRVSLVLPGNNDPLTKIMRARFAKF